MNLPQGVFAEEFPNLLKGKVIGYRANFTFRHVLIPARPSMPSSFYLAKNHLAFAIALSVRDARGFSLLIGLDKAG